MQNKILSLFSNTIPYIKELRPITGSVTATILMQQLDYWFARKPNGFYKYLEPPASETKTYKKGDSWTEETGFSAEEFRTAFKAIGVSYHSKTEFKEALKDDEVFYQDGKEMMYARYYDRGSGNSVYYRNHTLVDSILDNLNTSLETDDVGLRETDNLGFPMPLETDNLGLRETDDVGLHVRTEITNTKSTVPKITKEKEEPNKLALAVVENPSILNTKGDVTAAILELVPQAIIAGEAAKSAIGITSASLTKDEGSLFKIFNSATNLISAGCVDWKIEAAHCKKVIRNLRSATTYDAEDIICCMAWAYYTDKYSFYAMSTSSLTKLLPKYLDEKRTGKLKDTLSMKPKFESSAERSERILKERDDEQIIREAAAGSNESGRKLAVLP